MIKDLVVNLSVGGRDAAGPYAISVAEALGAHVAGVAFSYEPVIPTSHVALTFSAGAGNLRPWSTSTH